MIKRPHPGRRHRLLRAVVWAVGFSVPVAVLAVIVRSQVSPLLELDEALIRAATSVTRGNENLRGALLVWQEAFQAKWVNLACTLVFVWAWRKHGLKTRALWGFVTLMASWAIGLGIKHLVQRARPVIEDAFTHAPGYSFPSGHAANTAAAGFIVTLLVWPLLGPRGRRVVPVVVGFVIVATAADRVFLGVHYPSDVVAGIAVGAAMVGAAYLGYVGWHAVAPEAAAQIDRRRSA